MIKFLIFGINYALISLIKMKKIKLCAAQFEASNSFNKNIGKAEKFFRSASESNCSIVCFPEIFLTGAVNKKSYNKKSPIISKRAISKYCKNYNLYCIMGSIIEKIGRDYYNISYLFDSRGGIVGSYKKIHLVLKSEGKFIKAGDESAVFKTKIGSIGIQICRDLLYPEVTRKLMLKGAEIVFCPSFWAEKSDSYSPIYNNKYFKNRKPIEVDFLVSARAIESEVAFVYVNAAGNYNSRGSRSALLGRTQIALPFYGSVERINSNKEGILIGEIDLSIVKDAKKIYKIKEGIGRLLFNFIIS